MSKRLQITVTDGQHAFLELASSRTSLSMAELVRRALDEKYPGLGVRQGDDHFTVAVWKLPDSPAVARRAGVRID